MVLCHVSVTCVHDVTIMHAGLRKMCTESFLCHVRAIPCRMQSFRRSMRRSFRGRSRTTSSASLPASGTDGNNDRRKIAQSLNREAGMKEKGGQGGRRERGGGRQRIHSEPTQSRFEQSPPPSAPDQVPPEMMGVVTHLTFADTFVSGQGRGGEGRGREGGRMEGGMGIVR